MPRVLIRLAFDGARFAGTQRNPGRATVDGTVLDALDAAGLLAPEPNWRAAGRTDRGVSALDYPIAFDAAAEPRETALALAGATRGIVPWAGAVVADDFDPRRAARSRTYRYHWPLGVALLDMAAVAHAWKAFEGKHDFSAFSKLEHGRDPVRTILSTDVAEREGFLVFAVTGHAFLWNQVRRMVGAAIDAGAGRLTAEEIERALAGSPLAWHSKAPPEGLVLARVELPVETPAIPEARALGLARMASDLDVARMRMRVLQDLAGLVAAGRGRQRPDPRVGRPAPGRSHP